MWRFVLPGAGVVGMTLLLLAGSLASWPGGGLAPAGQSAAPSQPSDVRDAPSPTAAAELPKQSAPAAASDEEVLQLAQAALAKIPSVPPSGTQPDATPPPAAPAAPATPAPESSPAQLSRTAPPPPAANASAAPPKRPGPVAASPAVSPPSARLEQAEQAAPAAHLSESSADSAPLRDTPEADSFASVESLVHRLRASHRHGAARTSSASANQVSPSDRLATARALLAAGDADRARPLLEAAAAQLGLGSTDSNTPENPAIGRIDDALRWLGAGQPARALGLVDAAIATLGQGHGFSSLATGSRFARQAPGSGPDAGLW
jgi:hypothetical protein